MAVVKIYIGPDGNDANNGTTRALRIQGRTRLLALVDALGAGDTARIMAEGVFTRNTPGWGIVNHWFDLDGGANPKLQGFRISATKTEDAAAPWPEWCCFEWLTGAWTDTGTTTTTGTKIWSHAITGTAVGRVWAADSRTDSEYWKKELWEGGANYTTDFTNIHKKLDWVPGLDVWGTCWTTYNAAGSSGASTMYMACPVDPATIYPTLTYLTNGFTEILRIINLSNWTVDPEITLRGSSTTGKVCVMEAVGAAGPCLMEAESYSGSQYGTGFNVYGASINLTIGPVCDPKYPYEVPVYNGFSTGHNNSGNHGVNIDTNCDMSAADGYWDTPGATAFGLRIKAFSVRSNGTSRVNYIRDYYHAGVANVGPTTTYHQYISIDDGMQFDFRNVMYGRAFNFSGTERARYIRVGAIIAHNMPSPCQFAAYNSSWIGGLVHGKSGFGNNYSSPYGAISNKANYFGGFAAFSGSGGVNFSNIDVQHVEFMCMDGGWIPSVNNGVAFDGVLRIADCTVIRPWFQNAANYDQTFYQACYVTLQTSADEPMIQFRNNVTVGYASVCVKSDVISPLSGVKTTPDAALPAATNSGWTQFVDFGSYMQAKRVGQIRV